MLNILLVLGDQTGIDEPIIRGDIISPSIGARRFLTRTKTLKNPTQTEFYSKVQSGLFDAIIIVGHMCTNEDDLDGTITINNNPNDNSISINQFRGILGAIRKNKLRLVILAGCASIGAARRLVLNDINIPTVIAFKVPIHYKSVRVFFRKLFFHWIGKSLSLEMSIEETRAFLDETENNCPGAATIPILLHSSNAVYNPPLMFSEFSRSSLQGKTLELLLSVPLIRQVLNREPLTLPSVIQLTIISSLLIISIYSINELLNKRSSPLEFACNKITSDNISCGEEILLSPKENQPDNQNKVDAAIAIKNDKYDDAISLLSKINDDPEASVMLENAKLKSTKLAIAPIVKSIVVVIPATHVPKSIPTAMLKAAAFYQQQWNINEEHKWKLQIVLANDNNDSNNKSTIDLAKNIINRDIYGVIGHYSSSVTKFVQKIYQEKKVILISGTNTATDLTKPPGTFFFRICSTSDIGVKSKVWPYLKSLDHKLSAKIDLFHTTGQPFSDTLSNALIDANTGMEIISHDFQENLKKDDNKGERPIVLFPDAYTGKSSERDKSALIIRQNDGRSIVVGNEVIADLLSGDLTFEKISRKLLIILPWHPSTYPSTYNDKNKSELASAWKYWGQPDQLNHRIAMNYDAIKVMVTALDKLPLEQKAVNSRDQIRDNITNTQIDGITGSISFKGSNRADDISSFVKPKCQPNSTQCNGFEPAQVVPTSSSR
jgi:branched-chain amino acid transport system substrate-binding protein